ncbi:hypothetical protein ABPG74_015635 [Tetrahymena malaccensis]
MQQPPLGYTWEGIIDFLQIHQSIMKAREDQFDQEKAKFNVRIIQLEQEVGNLKLINETMSQRISELEVRIGIENPHQKINRQAAQHAKEVKQRNHQRVKSDQVQNFVKINEDFSANSSMLQKQAKASGLSFHVGGGSSSMSFYQNGSQVNQGLSLSNTFDGMTSKSLVHQFLQKVACDQEDSQNILNSDLLATKQHHQSQSANNSVNNGNSMVMQGEFDQNGKQKKQKKSTGSQKNTYIYNQTTVNSINSNNFINAYNNQQMQINQTLQNSFISSNKQQQTPQHSQSSSSNIVVTPQSANNGSHQQQGSIRLQENMSKSTPPNQSQSLNLLQMSQQLQQQPQTQQITQTNSQIIQQVQDLTSSQNLSQNKSKLKTNNLHINTSNNMIPNFLNNSISSSNQNYNTITKSIPLSAKNSNTFMNSTKSIITTNATSPHTMSDSSNENQMITGKKIWNPKCTLRSHLDGVRGLFFTAVDPILVTASEDCLIKLWDIRQFKDSHENSFLQPYYTIRGHTGQIFALTGNQQQVDSTINYQCYNFIFSAGIDGVIKAWNLPLPEEIDALGPSEGKSVSVGEWQAHHETIWDLNHHPFQPILLSSGADGYIKLWKTFVTVDGTNLISLQQGDLISYLTYKPGQFQDIPTSVSWDHQRSQILSGWAQSNNLVCFNIENSKISSIIKYNQENQNLSAQVNKVICHEGINCAISGHEDRQIRFFDLKSNSLIKNLIGHTDAVTGLSVHPNQFYMSSVGHDGSMRTWDIRKYQCIHDIPVHKRKYDESAHTVMYHQKQPLIATGGADGLVKIFHQQDMI